MRQTFALLVHCWACGVSCFQLTQCCTFLNCISFRNNRQMLTSDGTAMAIKWLENKKVPLFRTGLFYFKVNKIIRLLVLQ